MKTLIALLFPLSLFAQDIEVIQINAKWNKANDAKLVLENCRYSYAVLEDQPQSVQSQIKSVPTVLVMFNGRPVRQYQANVMLKLNAKEEDIQQYINSLLDD